MEIFNNGITVGVIFLIVELIFLGVLVAGIFYVATRKKEDA